MSFTLATDGVDPKRVPYCVLPTGAKIPVVGLGTFGSDHVSGEAIAAGVRDAIAAGYRHIDCATIYENQQLVGEGLKDFILEVRSTRHLIISCVVS